MKVSKWTLASTLAWAALISATERGEWAASWLALGTIALTPLALALIAALSPRRDGLMSAVDAEALVWTQSEPPAPPKPKGRPAEASRPAWRPQPLSA